MSMTARPVRQAGSWCGLTAVNMFVPRTAVNMPRSESTPAWHSELAACSRVWRTFAAALLLLLTQVVASAAPRRPASATSDVGLAKDIGTLSSEQFEARR
jgi:hypothetical protein